MNRLRLADILVRPMQRLTKYNLLLSAIRKNISEETDSEIMDAMVCDNVVNDSINTLIILIVFLLDTLGGRLCV